MSAYHLVLLAIAGAGTWACARACRGIARAEALAALAAMALAMSGVPALVGGGAGMLMLIALRPLVLPRAGLAGLPGSGGALCLHRAASNLVMAAVLLALLALNGAGICGAGALPLLTAEGVTLLPMGQAATLFVQATALALMAYLALSLKIGMGQWARGRVATLWEILPMTLATFGMAVRVA